MEEDCTALWLGSRKPRSTSVPEDFFSFNFCWALRSPLEGTGQDPHITQELPLEPATVLAFRGANSVPVELWQIAEWTLLEPQVFYEFNSANLLWSESVRDELSLQTNCLSAELITCGTSSALQIKSWHSISIWDLMKNSIPFCQCTQLPTVFTYHKLTFFISGTNLFQIFSRFVFWQKEIFL